MVSQNGKLGGLFGVFKIRFFSCFFHFLKNKINTQEEKLEFYFQYWQLESPVEQKGDILLSGFQ